MGPKDVEGMPNSVVPDQTVSVWSGIALFAQTHLSENGISTNEPAHEIMVLIT